MHAAIEEWVDRLKEQNFQERVIDQDPRKLRCFNLLGGDRSILEVFDGNRYLRINAISVLGINHTFHVLEYWSKDHPLKPKTDFYSGLHTDKYSFMTEEEVKVRFFS